MIRKFLTAFLAIVTGAACAESATGPDGQLVDGALDAAWEYKITGSGSANAGGGVIHVQISLTEFEGKTKGQVQYEFTRDDRKFHIDVDKFYATADGRYEMCGVVNLQEGVPVTLPDGTVAYEDGSRAAVAIRDNPDGFDDIRLSSNAQSTAIMCNGENTSFPATLFEGDYKVRQDN